MLKVFFLTLARLPLPLIHAIGILVGWLMYMGDNKFARRIRKNLQIAHITNAERDYKKLIHQNVRETGKAILETFAIWFKSETSVLKWIKACDGWEHVDTALAKGKGVIFLTPHLGCYEITARYYADRHPITVLFRPPRQKWLAPLVDEGRNHGQITMAPTTLKGVRSVLKALKLGQAIGILPDQVPEENEGVWANFFNTPAYTMTLVSKLAESTNATVLVAFGERLSWARGYVIHIEPLNAEATPQNINDAIERLVRKKPEQYLWSYSRFKKP
ncbi:MAG: lysophospholipid acyltransferase family protein [Methylophilaceae bacterium]